MAQTATQTTKKQALAARRPASEKPHRELKRMQEELAELTADILLNGGARSDVDLLLKALARHEYRRFLSGLRTIEKSELEIKARGDDNVERMYLWLSKEWTAARPKPSDENPGPLNTVLKVARADIRNRLQDQFEEFMSRMEGVEEAYILNEILECVTSGYGDLVQSFVRVIEDDHDYVRVRSSQADKVRAFVKLIDEKDSE